MSGAAVTGRHGARARDCGPWPAGASRAYALDVPPRNRRWRGTERAGYVAHSALRVVGSLRPILAAGPGAGVLRGRRNPAGSAWIAGGMQSAVIACGKLLLFRQLMLIRL